MAPQICTIVSQRKSASAPSVPCKNFLWRLAFSMPFGPSDGPPPPAGGGGLQGGEDCKGEGGGYNLQDALRASTPEIRPFRATGVGQYAPADEARIQSDFDEFRGIHWNLSEFGFRRVIEEKFNKFSRFCAPCKPPFNWSKDNWKSEAPTAPKKLLLEGMLKSEAKVSLNDHPLGDAGTKSHKLAGRPHAGDSISNLLCQSGGIWRGGGGARHAHILNQYPGNWSRGLNPKKSPNQPEAPTIFPKATAALPKVTCVAGKEKFGSLRDMEHCGASVACLTFLPKLKFFFFSFYQSLCTKIQIKIRLPSASPPRRELTQACLSICTNGRI